MGDYSKTSANKELPFISIVIPAYNEESHIATAIRSIHDHSSRKPYEYEIIVVDDGSDDGTVPEARKAARDTQASVRILLNGRNRGKGYSVRRGMLASQGDFALFSDADLSTPIHELDRMLAEALGGYDVVIGSRALRNSKIELHQPFYREVMGKTFNLILRSLGLSHFHDTQCGFKLFSRRAVQMIFPLTRVNRFAFDVEILLIAHRLFLPIKVLPVHWRDSVPSRVSLVRDSTSMFFDVLRLRFKAKTYAAERLRQSRSAKNSKKSS